MSADFETAFLLTFADPASEPGSPCALLHLLRRGIVRSLSAEDLWLAAFGLVGGIDHLSRLRHGNTTPEWRFRYTLSQNLGLDANGVDGVARMREAICGRADGPGGLPELTDGGGGIDVRALHQRFELAVETYRRDLASNPDLRASFVRVFEGCGRVTIGRARPAVPGAEPLEEGTIQPVGPDTRPAAVPGADRLVPAGAR